MTFFAATRWFDIDKDGPPVRIGVFEGTAVGLPGQDDRVAEHGYYHWNGQRWGARGTSPAEAFESRRKAPLYPVSNWRGVVADEGYPFDEVSVAHSTQYLGELRREASDDKLNVTRLEEEGGRLHLGATRIWGTREPVVLSVALDREGTSYFGATKGEVRGFPLAQTFHVRVIYLHKDEQLVDLSVSLHDNMNLHVFSGRLQRAM